MTWQVWKAWVVGGGGEGSEEVARWERCKCSEVAMRSERGRRAVKWQGGWFVVLFKSEGHKVSLKFHLFISDVYQQQNEVA